MSTRLLLVAGGSTVIAVVATPAAAAVARRTGVVDRPGALKPQAAAVAYLGGAAVFVAVVVGGAAGRPALLAPLALALALGTADDVAHLPPWTRLVGEVATGAVVAAVVPTGLPRPLGPVLVAAVTVVLMNGVNMIDGLDALAAGVAAAAGGAYAWLLRGDGRELGLGLACALAGFLLYNRPPARIYLGDGGAYLIGTTLAVLLASTWAPAERLPVGVAGLVLVAVPSAEVLFAVVRRLRLRRSLLFGDRGHPYDRLVARGWPAPGASLLYIGVEVACAVAAVAVAPAASAVPAVVTAAVVAAVLVVAAALTGVLTPLAEDAP